MYTLNLKSLTMENFTIEEAQGHTAEIVRVQIPGDVSYKNFSVKGFSNTGTEQLPPFSIIASPSSNVIFEDMYFENLEIFNVPLVSSSNPLFMSSFNNFVFKDFKFTDDLSIINLETMTTNMVDNFTLQSVSPVVETGGNARLFNAGNINFGSMVQSQFTNIQIQNSSLSLLSLGGIIGLDDSQKEIIFDNIQFQQCVIQSVRSLISTNGFVGNVDLTLKFNKVSFTEITFGSQGNLFDLNHQLSNPIEITNSVFNQIYSGSLRSRGSFAPGGQPNKISLSNATFSLIKTPIVPFIITTSGSELSLTQCTFTTFTSENLFASVLWADESSSILLSHSSFTQIAARTNSILRVEAGATLSCEN